MPNLKSSVFWTALYVAVVFVLGGTDYAGRPIINFASYFYLAVLIAVPVTLFFPSISKLSPFVPLVFWAGIYLVVLQTINRNYSARAGEFSVIVLEFILLELGVWLAYELARQISNAESIMDALALSTFPNRAQDIDEASQRIKIELTRSRRYHRPISLLVIETGSEKQEITKEMFKSIQSDLFNRFTFARVGQIIDDRLRQTDLVLKDHRGHFVVLCPETDLSAATMLAKRIVQAIEERTGLHILWGVASFPDEALTFEDLLQRARERLLQPVSLVENQSTLVDEPQKEITEL